MSVPDTAVDARGTRRRLQALVRLGWSERAIAAAIGCAEQHVVECLRRPTVDESTRDKVAAVYEVLSSQLPPETTQDEHDSVARTRRLAQRRGWVAPLAWDDIDVDDAPQNPEPTNDADLIAVDFVVAGEPLRLTRIDRLVAVRKLHALGYYDTEIAVLTCVDQKTIERDREELGLPGNQFDASSLRPHIPAYRRAA